MSIYSNPLICYSINYAGKVVEEEVKVSLDKKFYYWYTDIMSNQKDGPVTGTVTVSVRLRPFLQREQGSRAVVRIAKPQT